MEMFHSIEAKIDALISALNGNGNTVPNNPAAPVSGAPLDKPATAALLQDLIKALQDGGFLPEKPLYKRGVDNGTPAGPFSSIGGPNLTLWKLKELNDKIKVDNFVARLPHASAVAANPGSFVGFRVNRNTWSVRDVTTVRKEYYKLADVVKELKTILRGLEIK